MKKIIFIFCLVLTPLLSVSAADMGEIYQVNVIYDQGALSLGAVSLSQGYASSQQPEMLMSPHRYYLEIISVDGQILHRQQYSLSLEISKEPPEEGREYPAGEGGMQVLDYTEDLVMLPYFSNAQWLTLYGANHNLIERMDISYLSHVCGDGGCRDNENSENCPQDCPFVCTPGSQDLRCNTDTASNTAALTSKALGSRKVIMIIGIGLAVLVLLATGILLYVKKKKQNLNITG